MGSNDFMTEALLDRASHPLLLHACLQKMYTIIYTFWEIETVLEEISRATGIQTLPLFSYNKIQAVRALTTNDRLLGSYQHFGGIAIALCGDTPDYEVINRPTPLQIFRALICSKAIQPKAAPDKNVYRLCAAAMLDQGVLGVPEPETVPGLAKECDRINILIKKLRPPAPTAYTDGIIRNVVDTFRLELEELRDRLHEGNLK